MISITTAEKHIEEILRGNIILVAIELETVTMVSVLTLSKELLLCIGNSWLLFAEAIVGGAFGLIGEDLVGVRNLLECFRGFGIFATIRMTSMARRR
jgi:hypothetical protein